MKCSVVIPARNDSAHLAHCLEALARQSRAPDEIVVVDNASTDDLPAVLRAHPGVRCVREDTPGVAHAVHTGYDAARFPVILRCDADSVPPVHWVECMAGAVEHLLATAGSGPGREVVAVSGDACFGPPSSTLGRWVGTLYLRSYRLVGGCALGHPCLWGSNLAFSARWWRSVREGVHLGADIHDDYDLSFRVGPRQRIRLEHGSVMPVSWRAASSPRRIVRQLRMAFATLRANWREERPWERLAARLRGTRG